MEPFTERIEADMQNPKNLNPPVHLHSVATTRRVAVRHREVAFWNTMIGKKVVMAITGIALIGFVIGHMLGNLKIFTGAETINAYSRFLREVGMPELEYGQLLWLVRIFLLICVALHITAAVQLTRMSRAARPIGYDTKRDIETTWGGRTQRWGGGVLVDFILLHYPERRPVPPPRPRNREPAANPRLEHCSKRSDAADDFAGHRGRRVPGIHLRSRCRNDRLDTLKETHMLEANIRSAQIERQSDKDFEAKESTVLEARIPSGPIEQQWDKCRFEMKLVNPANRRKHSIIVVGAGLAGAAAPATLGQQGYHVHCFSYHDTPRRAHSIAAQGGINAAKNYRNDGDSIFRLFKDTVKGGDYRAREANVYRLAQISLNIIDQCVAQGVPFAREYGGLLDNRSFGGVQVSRTFYARGQTGQQLLLGAYQALLRQIGLGTVKSHTHA